MNIKMGGMLAVVAALALTGTASAQDLGPRIKKLTDGVYVYEGIDFNSNAGIILTSEGVVLVDSGHNPTDSRAIVEIVKKLTPLPIRYLIDSEPHADHTTGHYVFASTATI